MTTKYGTPEDVVFCKRCVMSNQRPSSVVEWQSDGTRKPSLAFNADGICAACEYQAIMDTQIDWEARDRELRELCDAYRSKSGLVDVIVPGSGGKDSTFTAHVLKHRYGMHPLLVTWSPMLYTEVGRRNVERWANIAEHVLVTPNRETHRKLTRLAFLNLAHSFQPFVVGQRSIGPRYSQLYGVDLVAYGEAPSMYAGPVSENFTPWMQPRFYTGSQDVGDLVLGGVTGRELMREHGIDAADLRAYLPIDDNAVTQTCVFYLGYFLKWDPQEVFYYAQEHCGFEVNDERTEGSYSKYSSIDDMMDTIHYASTFLKFGIGRATYDASHEVRNGKIDRDEAVALVKRYDAEVPVRYLGECLDYMELLIQQYWDTMNAARPPHLWRHNDDGTYTLKHAVWQ